MNVIERLAREIEPIAWQRYDDALRPYLEDRAPSDDYGEGTETVWYRLTQERGMTTAEEVSQWFLKDAEPPTLSQSIAKTRSSLEKAKTVLNILSSNEGVAACPLCKMQREIEASEAKRHNEHVEIGSVLILEEPDRTVLSIYKPLTPKHRRQMLDLMRSIVNAGTEECENNE